MSAGYAITLSGINRTSGTLTAASVGTTVSFSNSLSSATTTMNGVSVATTYTNGMQVFPPKMTATVFYNQVGGTSSSAHGDAKGVPNSWFLGVMPTETYTPWTPGNPAASHNYNQTSMQTTAQQFNSSSTAANMTVDVTNDDGLGSLQITITINSPTFVTQGYWPVVGFV